MNRILRWLRDRWAALSNDKLRIVNPLGAPVSGLYLSADRLPYSTNYHLRLPAGIDGPWTYEWRWLGDPLPGVEFDPVTGFAIDLTVHAHAPVNVTGRLECVGRAGGVAWLSDPLTIRVLPPDNNV